MKITIETRERKSGKLNMPTLVKIALTEERISVAQYINDLYFSSKIDGIVYKNLLNKTALYTKQNKPEEIERLFL